MGRRTFSPEFKLEAVKLVRERGVTIRRAASDLGLHVNVLRKWGAPHVLVICARHMIVRLRHVHDAIAAIGRTLLSPEGLLLGAGPHYCDAHNTSAVERLGVPLATLALCGMCDQ